MSERQNANVSPFATYATQGQLTSALAALDARVASEIVALQNPTEASVPQSVAASGNPFVPYAAISNIGQLAETAVSNPSVSGGSITNASISGGPISATTFSASGDATLSGNLTVGGSLNAGALSFTYASTTGINTQEATFTAATSTNFFSSIGQFTNAIVSTLNTSIANIVGITATNATISTLRAGNASVGALIATSSLASYGTASFGGTATSTFGTNGALNLSQALGVASGGTGWANINSGSILFGNGGSALATSSNLYWDNTDGRLGIGTPTPDANLSLSGTMNLLDNATSYQNSANYSGTSTAAAAILAVTGSQGSPDLSTTPVAAFQKWSGYGGVASNDTLVATINKGANGGNARATAAYFEAMDSSGWNGVGQNNFIEGVRSQATLESGTALGSGYGGVFAAGENSGTLSHTYLIGVESEVDDTTQNATTSFNNSSYVGSYVASTNGGKHPDVAFVVNPWTDASSSYVTGFFVPAGQTNSPVEDSAFRSDAATVYGLNLENATGITHASIGLPNNVPIYIKSASGSTDYAALSLDTNNLLEVGTDPNMAGFKLGRVGGIDTIQGTAGFSGNVGIGTTTPSAALTVTTASTGYNAPSAPMFFINDTAHPAKGIFEGIDENFNGGTGYIQAVNIGTSWNNLALDPNGSADVIVDGMSGQSGLTVNGNESIGTYYGTAAPSNGLIVSGNVGIGTTTAMTNFGSTAGTSPLTVNGGMFAQGYGIGNNSTTSPQVVYVGDSLTYGADGSHPYTYYITLPTYNGLAFNATNIGVNGRLLSDMLPLAPTNLNPLYAYNAGMNIAVIWGGTNDIGEIGTSPQQTFSYLQEFAQTERRLGWKVFVVTMISRGGYDTQKDQYNELIRTQWPNFADGLIDVAANPNLGADGASANSTYFQPDQTHLTDVGYELVGSIVQNALTSYIGSQNKSFINANFLGGVFVGTSTPAATSTAMFQVWNSSGLMPELNVSPSGLVGLGTTTPYSDIASSPALLDLTTNGIVRLVMHDTASSQEEKLSSDGTGFYIDSAGAASAANNNIVFRVSNANSSYTTSEAGRFTAAGLFGVGTTSPWAQLSASSTSGNPALAIQQNSSGAAAVFLGGNVGIGTTSPATTLSVSGNTYLTGTLTYGGVTLANSVKGTGSLVLSVAPVFTGTTTFSGTSGNEAIRINGAGGSWFWIDNPTGTMLRFSSGPDAGASPGFVLTSAGNVGIGTTTPQSVLDVVTPPNDGNLASIPSGNWESRIMNLNDNATENGLLVMNRWAGTGSTVFQVGSAYNVVSQDFFSINGVGTAYFGNSVGIGTTTPSAALQVSTSFTPYNSTNPMMLFINDSAHPTRGIYVGTDGNFNTNTGYIQAVDIGAAWRNLGLDPNGGNVVINGMTGSSAFNVLGGVSIGSSFTNTAAPSNGMIVQGNESIGTSSPSARLTVWGPDAASTTAFAVVNSASTTAFAVYDSGNATYSGSIFQSSDQRLKSDVQSLDGSSSLAEIERLNPVSYTRIDQPGGGQNLGFLAQAVQAIFSELVSTTSPTALTPDGTLTLNYTGLIAPIVSAIQALASQLAALETTVADFSQSFVSQQITATEEICLANGPGDPSPACITKADLVALLSGAGRASSATALGTESGSSTVQNSSPGGTATDTPPVIQINGDDPASVDVGATYNDLGATITGPQADLNLGIDASVDGGATTTVDQITIDTTEVGSHTILYCAADQSGLSSCAARTVNIVSPTDASTTATSTTI